MLMKTRSLAAEHGRISAREASMAINTSALLCKLLTLLPPGQAVNCVWVLFLKLKSVAFAQY